MHDDWVSGSSTDPAVGVITPPTPQVDDFQRVTPEILKTACCHIFLTSFYQVFPLIRIYPFDRVLHCEALDPLAERLS